MARAFITLNAIWQSHQSVYDRNGKFLKSSTQAEVVNDNGPKFSTGSTPEKWRECSLQYTPFDTGI